MAKRVEIEGLDELIAQLSSLKDIGPGVGDAVKSATKVVEQAIRAEAPEDTGGLKAAISAGLFKKRARKPNAGFVMVDGKKTSPTNLGALQEFGTSRMQNHKGKGFFSRGWAKSRAQAEAELAVGIRAAIDKAI